MWGRLLAATALAVLFGGASASAQGYAHLSNWCYGEASEEQTIRGCTAVIQWARESPRDTGAAFYNRGIAFAATGRLDRALSDYGNALRLRPDADVFNNRVPQQTAEEYHYTPAQGQSLVFEDASVTPAVARRGQFIEARMQYALLGASAGAPITERRVILKGDQLISEISAEEHTRNDGTWVSLQEFKVPDSWTPGDYVLEQTVQTTRLTVSGRARFRVE